jgi:DNA-binding transcriptional ArsR family regulator
LTFYFPVDTFNLMVNKSSDRLDLVFGALTDPTRRRMLRNLALRDRTVSELAEPFSMSLAAASKHVRMLERAGLVRRTVQGRKHYCRLNAKPLANANEWLRFYEQFWNERLDALEALLCHPDHQTGESDD